MGFCRTPLEPKLIPQDFYTRAAEGNPRRGFNWAYTKNYRRVSRNKLEV